MTDVVRFFLPVLMAMTCIASNSYGLELKGTTRAGVMVSDNINRKTSGLEESGSLLTQGFGVQISETRIRRSFDLSLVSGWESMEGTNNFGSNEVYRINMDASLPWSSTGHVDVTAGTSRETVTPETEAPDQERELVKRFETGLLVANKASIFTTWQVEVSRRMSQSVTMDLTETTTGFEWSRILNRVSTISLQGTNAWGDDDIDMDSWQKTGSSVVLENRVRQNITRSYSMSWEEVVIKDAGGARGRYDKVSLNYRLTSQTSTEFNYEIAFGIDHLKTPSDGNIAEPSTEVAVKGPLSRVVTTNASIGYSLQIQDPFESNTGGWAREGRLSAGATWNVSRFFSVLPNVEYLWEDIRERNIPGRRDQTFLFKVGTRWVPASDWIVNLGVAFENRESTEPLNELDESRLELSVMTAFL